ncbi:hypothetical protein SEMRO_822_G207470.1 [Seminavis robusta]|uniref:Uncharacterized protein n=1 Tax=Seminavis robusta TaxID=568900 RepID=A0A9N8HJ09_9STRA|nr:hypothetical protein SEMRO_822_G207470.1 [Seminavis robusta]|eukprot:Sro822_g207470.1 n/a (174) ;mRNA; f:22186-22707
MAAPLKAYQKLSAEEEFSCIASFRIGAPSGFDREEPLGDPEDSDATVQSDYSENSNEEEDDIDDEYVGAYGESFAEDGLVWDDYLQDQHERQEESILRSEREGDRRRRRWEKANGRTKKMQDMKRQVMDVVAMVGTCTHWRDTLTNDHLASCRRCFGNPLSIGCSPTPASKLC